MQPVGTRQVEAIQPSAGGGSQNSRLDLQPDSLPHPCQCAFFLLVLRVFVYLQRSHKMTVRLILDLQPTHLLPTNLQEAAKAKEAKQLVPICVMHEPECNALTQSSKKFLLDK